MGLLALAEIKAQPKRQSALMGNGKKANDFYVYTYINPAEINEKNEKKKIKSASATLVAVAVPLACTLVAAKLTPSCLPCSLPIHIFLPLVFLLLCSIQKIFARCCFRFSPFFFRFFFLCIFVFICKISSLISVRVRLGPPCVCVCVCVDAWGVFYAIEMQPSISAAPPAPNLCVCCCCCCSQRATGFRCI